MFCVFTGPTQVVHNMFGVIQSSESQGQKENPMRPKNAGCNAKISGMLSATIILSVEDCCASLAVSFLPESFRKIQTKRNSVQTQISGTDLTAIAARPEFKITKLGLGPFVPRNCLFVKKQKEHIQ